MPEKEYIEREAALKILQKSLVFSENELDIGEFKNGCIAAIQDDIGNIKHIPTADVAEVNHGEWIKTDNIPNKDHILVECSLCHSGHYLKKFLNDSNGEQTYKHHCETVHFCLSCGAKMDGGKNV